MKDQQVAEEATGIVENRHGLGVIYSGPSNVNGRVVQGGSDLTPQQAQDLIREGGSVALPNAGAGSYRKAFALLGFEKCEVFEQNSSAGDWSFAVFDGESWFPASQSNRYPYHGFLYGINAEWSFPTAKECFDFMMA